MSQSEVYKLLQQRPIRIRLNVDLTKYHPDLKQGVEGFTQFEQATWGCYCWFDDTGRWDIIMDSGVEIIDEEYLKAKEKDEAKESKLLEKAYDVELYLGPRGGFRELSYRYVDEHGTNTCATGFKEEADKLIKFFKEHNVSIKETRVR